LGDRPPRLLAVIDLEEAAMSSSHLEIIDRNVEKAHIWVNGVAEELGTDDREQAFRVLRAFLHALRDHLSVDVAAQLSAQLPIFVRGVFYEAWNPNAMPNHTRDLDSFLDRIAAEARLAGETEASFAAAAANRVLQRHISTGERDAVLHVLPRHVRAFLESSSG
jgi:uncharacterized protein (DUF2267 family)